MMAWIQDPDSNVFPLNPDFDIIKGSHHNTRDWVFVVQLIGTNAHS